MWTRRAALGVALLLCLPIAAAQPRRVMSLNLCADQLAMALLPPERIVSITWLSRTEGDPALRSLAMRLPANHGGAEEVLHARPDLVIAGRYTTAATRQLLRRTGVPLLEIDAVNDWEGIRRVTREVAAARGESGRGEAWLAAMEADLAASAASGSLPPLRVLGWGGAGVDVPGHGSTLKSILADACLSH